MSPWLEWSPAAFDKARAEDKCIVLSLGTSWSRWGRRMERDTFTDPDVIRLLERDYIPVKVDADRRPDVADRYTPGSLPAVTFLNPAGTLLYGAGFLDAGELQQLLVQFKTGYMVSKDRLAEAIRERDSRIDQVLRGRYPNRGSGPGGIFARTVAGILETVDAHNGGFGDAAKAANVPSLRVLLRDGSEPALKALEATLDAMRSRAMWDAVDGGFFTGTFDPRWSQPSFEKSPEDNAALIRIYIDAGRVLKRPDYVETAQRIAEWALKALWDGTRFLGSQESDDEYYTLPPDKRSGRKLAVDPTVFAHRNAQWAGAMLPASKPGIAEKALAAARGESHLLRDRLALAAALLDAGQVLEAASIGDRLVPDFWSGEERGLLDRRPGVDELGELSRRKTNLADTSKGALLLLRLAKLTHEPRFRQGALSILDALPDFSPDYGHYTADLALACKEVAP